MNSPKFKSVELDQSIAGELAKEIEYVDTKMQHINQSRLQRSTLVQLIAADSGVSTRSVSKVLDAMSGLRKKHLKP